MKPVFSQRLAMGAALVAAVGLFATAFSAEEPLGSLRGRLVVEGSDQPLREVAITVRPKTPRNGSDSHYLKTDAEGEFEIARLRTGDYDIEPMSSSHQNKSVAVTVTEGEAATAELKLLPGDPYLNLNVHQHAFLPDDNPRIGIQGFRQGDAVRMRLLAVDDANLMLDNGQGLRDLLQPVASGGKQGRFRAVPGQSRVVREWAHTVKNRNGEGVFYDVERLGRQKPGIYLVEAHGSAHHATGWLMVTDLALVTKSTDGKVLAYATDLRTGQPRPGTQITFFHNSKKVSGGTTSGSGLAELKLPGGPGDSFEALARSGGSLAHSRFYPFGYSSDGKPDYRVHTYTDRPVYRPGHLVRFKGVARRIEAVGYGVPSPQTVEITVADEQETVLYQSQVPLNDRGSYHGEFRLPSEAVSGVYNIQVDLAGEEHVDTFAVASYRKPEWRVDVETGKKSYIRGERVPVTVRGTYYFGAPVVEGKVTYTVFRSQHWSWWDGEEEYADEEESGNYGEVVHSGETTTDADGAARFEFPTEQAPEQGWTGDYDYSVEATIEDMSGRIATGEGSVRVSAGEITLDARSSRYVAAPGEAVTVSVKAEDLDEKPVANAEVTAVTSLEIWKGNKPEQKVLDQQTLRTDAAGKASLTVRLPEPGLVIVRLQTRDPRGNKIETTADVWVSTADGGDYATHYPSLSVVPDKKLYRTGDTAQILINTDKPGATALVAVEGDRIMEHRMVLLKSKSTIVRFKIFPGYEPNVFVTACFVKNREFESSDAKLNINAEAHQLKVEVESDRSVYHPGDTATFRVRTTNAAGRAQPAEVSFGLVDEAVYAIKVDQKNGLWRAFYPLRQNAVLTEFSYPSIYLGDADKDGGEVALRKSFPDTAYWNPTLRTDASGRATVQVKLPDNLTSWRATVQGHTARTEVGAATFNVQVAKELTLRLQTPRSLTEGDRLTLSAVAHNYSSAPLDVTVNLRAAGLQVEGGAKRVRLEPGKAERVEWNTTAGTPGEATVTATASGGRFTDGVQLAVPVRPFAREEVQFKTGALTGDAVTEELSVNPNAATGEVEIRVAPSVAGTILGALDYLATYPHGCTEQTMSGFLPDVVILRLMDDLDLKKPNLENRLPEMTRDGLLRLYRFQHGDGGWGWWENDASEPWMTAYVLFGMQRAKEAGVPVNPRVWTNGLDALKQHAKHPKLTANDGMFVAYVLAETGQSIPARQALERFEKQVEKLQRRSLGYRTLAFAALGDTARARSSMQYLWSVVEEFGGVYNWAEKRPEWDYGTPQDVESTAVILKAALATTPNDPRLPSVVRWLLLKRNGNRWESTRDTAWILFALADYLKRTGELSPDYRLEVALNGREIHTDDLTPGEGLKEETVVRVPLKDLQRGAANRLEVRKNGAGTVYYSVKTTQHVKTEVFSPESSVSGLSVEREYYRLETQRDGLGRISVVPEAKPTTRLQVGDRVLVRLRIRNERRLEYLMLESPLPTGCEVQDRGDMTRNEWRDGGYWWSHQDVRDDRINLFIRNLPTSKPDKPHVIEYYLRPEMSGQVRALPAVLSDMYNPAVRASTAESRLEVGK